MSLTDIEPDTDPIPHWERAEANPSKVPSFENQKVTSAKAKLTSVSGLEIDDRVMRLDEMVQLFVEGRVVRVDHVVHEASGELHRIQTIKVIEGRVLDAGDL